MADTDLVLIEHPAVQNQAEVTREAFELTWQELGWIIAEKARDTAPESEVELPFDFDIDNDFEDNVLDDNEGE
jgi:hypothetical protein